MHRKRLAPARLHRPPAPHLTSPPTDHAADCALDRAAAPALDRALDCPQAHAPGRNHRLTRTHSLARTLAATLVVVAAVTCGSGYLTATARASGTATSTEKRVLALINHARATHGMPGLRIVASLERASRAHSREMVSRDYFSHSSYSGESFSSRLIRFGFSPSGCSSWTAGEDIGYGSGSHGSPTAIFQAWMHSPPHRAVILNRRFRSAGVGRAAGVYKGIPGVVFFTLDCGARSN